MDITKHELLFSRPRITPYLSSCNSDDSKAVKLYKYNIQASQALYPIISILEIALRNGIDKALANYYNDKLWLINKRNDFANNPNLTYKDKIGNIKPDLFFIDKLKKAEDKIRFRNVPINHGKLIAELTFGFWVKFFDAQPIKILKGAPLHGLKNRPSMKLAKVHSHLNSIVNVRNRISHSEPICFNKKGNICLLTLAQYESDILDAIKWIDNDLAIWANKMNFFKPVYNRISAL